MSTKDREEHRARLEAEVQTVAREISFNFVPKPTFEEVKSDLLVALKRYRKSVRARLKTVERNRNQGLADDAINPNADDGPTTNGLGTKLRPAVGAGYDTQLPASPAENHI